MMHRNRTSLVLFVALAVSLGSSSTVDARRVSTPGRRRQNRRHMQSSGRQLLRQRHLKQEEDENENEDGNGGDDGIEYDAITKRSDEVKTSERAYDDNGGDDEEDKTGVDADKKYKENSKTADPTAAPTIGTADDDINVNATVSTVSRTVGDVDGDDNTSSNSTQTTGTSQPTTAPTNTTTNTTATPSPTNSNSTSSPSPTAAPTVETYDCYDHNPCLDAAERQVHYYRHADPTKFVQCGAAATCFTMSCHDGLVWSLEDTACVVPVASP